MTAATLLGPDDPAPFERVNWTGAAPIFLTCDHASHAVPAALDGLGIDRAALTNHIGWDIGAAKVTRRLAELLDAPAVLAGYSRLIVDCNRPPEATDRIPAVSDGVAVPANRGLDEAAVAARVEAFFTPYHAVIREGLEAKLAAGMVPALIAIHSFTPALNGVRRPWHVGVCWEHDPRLPQPLLAALRAELGIVVGDNEPYAIVGPTDYTMPEHGAKRGLPHALIEIRNDLIRDQTGVEAWAERLAGALTTALADPAIHRIQHY